MRPLLLVALALGALLVAAPAPARPDAEAAACRATPPNGRTPPGERRTPSLHGNGKLFVALYYPRLVARTIQRDGSVWEKFPWWADGPTGRLQITGRRLDGPAGPLRSRVNAGWPDNERPFRGTAFWSSGLGFPRVGCWRVTGRADGVSLSFVVQVVKPAK